MSLKTPLATPDEAELVFSLLRGDRDVSSGVDAVRGAVRCAVKTTVNPRTLAANSTWCLTFCVSQLSLLKPQGQITAEFLV